MVLPFLEKERDLHSKESGISRTQFKDMLAELEMEGFITRRHGVGTVISCRVLRVNNCIELEMQYLVDDLFKNMVLRNRM